MQAGCGRLVRATPSTRGRRREFCHSNSRRNPSNGCRSKRAGIAYAPPARSPHRTDPRAAGSAQRARDVCAGRAEYLRGLFRQPARRHGTGRAGAGVSAGDADTDALGGRHRRGDLGLRRPGPRGCGCRAGRDAGGRGRTHRGGLRADHGAAGRGFRDAVLHAARRRVGDCCGGGALRTGVLPGLRGDLALQRLAQRDPGHRRHAVARIPAAARLGGLHPALGRVRAWLGAAARARDGRSGARAGGGLRRRRAASRSPTSPWVGRASPSGARSGASTAACSATS